MVNMNKLTLAEEYFLITLDDESGMLLESIKLFKNHIAIAASLIMELTLKGKVDLDAKKLFVVSSVKTGIPILDMALDEIVAEKTTLNTTEWLERFAKKGLDLSNQIRDSLVTKGVMRLEDRRLFWILKTRSYSAASGIEEREVKTRILLLLNSDDIPDSNDVLLVGLLKAVGIFNLLLPPSELARLQNRIDEISNLEEINRSLSASIQETWELLSQIKGYHNY